MKQERIIDSTSVKNGWLREKLDAFLPWAVLILILLFGVPQTIQFFSTGIMSMGANTETQKSKNQDRELAEMKIKIDNLVSATSKLTDIAQQTTLTTTLNTERISQINERIREIKLQLRR